MAKIVLSISLLLMISLGGCQFAGAAGGLAGAAGQVEQQLPGALTVGETIAVNTLILRYQELQRLKMVLDGQPVPQLPPLPPSPNPVPVVIVPPTSAPAPPPGPVRVPPPHILPPKPVPLPADARSHARREQVATERHPDFWSEHPPGFRLVAGPSGMSAEPR